MWNGKKKAITFSYDDGVTQDVRLVALFNKYGIKSTFNINYGRLGQENALIRNGVRISHNKVEAADVRHIYEGHEVAGHTLTHPSLLTLSDDEVVREVEEDRLRLSELVGYEVKGFAYPGGSKYRDARVDRAIRERTGARYARGTDTTGSFAVPQDLYHFKPSCYHHPEWERMWQLAEEFLSLAPDEPALFYIWGHAYEFDIYPERWVQLEAFLEMISEREDVFYGTNREVLLGE